MAANRKNPLSRALPKRVRKGFSGVSKVPASLSNLATPTENGLSNTRKAAFFPKSDSVADSSVRRKRSRTPLLNSSGYPYYPAEIVPENHDMKQPWYIKYYVWDVGLQKLMRRRVLKRELAMRRDYDQRVSYANDCINEINDALRRGGYQETEEKEEPETSLYNFRDHSLLEALKFVIEYKEVHEKCKRGTLKEYKTTRNSIIDFFREKEIAQTFKLRKINKDFVDRYLSYLINDRKIEGKTYNCRVSIMRASINTLTRLDFNLKMKNYFTEIPFIKTTSYLHAAYTHDQMAALQDSISADGETFVLLFIQFIYFTLARPRREVRLIKVGHIDMRFRRILLAGENAKTGEENYIGISEAFAQVIERSGILGFPSNYYVFSFHNNEHRPGLTPVGENVYYKRFVKHLDKLGYSELNPHYDMYSFKHSGAIDLWLATGDLYLVMKQCRHRTLEQTQIYLRQLGMFVNASELNKWKNPFDRK